jgi:putative ABC transport system permease protein
MFDSRWYKVFNDLWENKTRTILIVLSIAVGVTTFGALFLAREATMRDMYTGFWANTPPAMILFLEPFDQDLIPFIRHMPQVTDVEARRAILIHMQLPSGEDRFVSLSVLGDYYHSRISQVRPVSGAWPPGRREVLLERSVLSMYPFKEGDSITVETFDEKEMDLRVAGFVHEFNETSSNIDEEVRGFITLDTLAQLGAGTHYDRLYITIEGDISDHAWVADVRNDITQRLEGADVQVFGFEDDPPPGEHWAESFYTALLMILGLVGGLSLVLSGVLIVNTIMAAMAREIQQVGVMKAIGARQAQVMGIYLGMVVLYGGLSLFLSIPLGLLGAYGFAHFAAGAMNYELQGLEPRLWVLVVQVVLSLGVPAVAAFFPVYAGTRQTVREALSDYSVGTVQVGWIERGLGRVRGLPRPLILSLRNTFRRKLRLVLTLSALSLAGAIFIGVLSTRASVLSLAGNMYSFFDYEIEVAFERPLRPASVEAPAFQLPQVTHVEGWRRVTAMRVYSDDRKGTSLRLSAPYSNPETISPPVIRGRWLLPEDDRAIVVSTEFLRDESDLDVGDEITFQIEGQESTWQIVGVILVSDKLGYVNYPALVQTIGMPGRVNQVHIRISDPSPQAQRQVARLLTERYQQAGLPVFWTFSLSDEIEKGSTEVELASYLLLTIAGLLTAVGGLGVAATMGLNVLERTREIGVMRAIGASNQALALIIVVEGVIVGLFSWVLGTLLSVPVGKLLTDGVGTAFYGMEIDYLFSFSGIAFWLLITVGISAVASLMPAYRASQISVRESLAYE